MRADPKEHGAIPKPYLVEVDPHRAAEAMSFFGTFKVQLDTENKRNQHTGGTRPSEQTGEDTHRTSCRREEKGV